MLLILCFAGQGQAEPLKKGAAFPNVALAGELTAAQKIYLGLSGKGPWTLADVQADYVMIEVFSMYCPHCQAEAPAVNELFSVLQKNNSSGRMKFLAIGAGNSGFEVDVFRKKYQIEMPLFEDADLALHMLLGQPGTPHFYLVSLKNGVAKTVSSHAGRMESTPDAFLKTLLQEADL